MNILHLKYVLEVQKTGSISQAANNLYMNQPNLSKSIKELEESLGILIFHRTPQGVTPTQKGEEFLFYAREIVQKADALVQFCREGESKTLSVAAPPAGYIGSSFVETVNKYFTMSANFSCKYSEMSTLSTVDSILTGEHSMGIVRYSCDDSSSMEKFLTQSKLVYKELLRFSPMLIFSNTNPLVLAEEITPAMLEEQTEIEITSEGYSLSLSDTAQKSGHSLQATDRTSQYQLLQELPNTYRWGSPAPIKVLEHNNLVQRRMPSRTEEFIDSAIHLQGRSISQVENDFIEEIQKTILRLR